MTSADRTGDVERVLLPMVRYCQSMAVTARARGWNDRPWLDLILNLEAAPDKIDALVSGWLGEAREGQWVAAADEVGIEARWQLELKLRAGDNGSQQVYTLERLAVLEQIFRDRADFIRCARESGQPSFDQCGSTQVHPAHPWEHPLGGVEYQCPGLDGSEVQGG